jgi:hypothetical protein
MGDDIGLLHPIKVVASPFSAADSATVPVRREAPPIGSPTVSLFTQAPHVPDDDPTELADRTNGGAASVRGGFACSPRARAVRP